MCIHNKFSAGGNYHPLRLDLTHTAYKRNASLQGLREASGQPSEITIVYFLGSRGWNRHLLIISSISRMNFPATVFPANIVRLNGVQVGYHLEMELCGNSTSCPHKTLFVLQSRPPSGDGRHHGGQGGQWDSGGYEGLGTASTIQPVALEWKPTLCHQSR